MNSNQKITLGEISTIFDCEHKTAPTQDEGIPSIRTPNIGKGRLILDNVNRVSEETYRLWTRRAIPEAGDLILAREAPVGNVALIPKGLKVCLGQRTVLIRPDRDVVDSGYLTYLLNSATLNGILVSLSNGSTVGHLNVGEIRKLPLPVLPPLPLQRKITAVLTAYDDLIENNTRRIAILEQMAEEIYREWFVRMRFPGHERVKFQKGVPEGWELRKVQDSFEISGGGTPSKKNPRYWQNGDINWYTPSDLTKDSALFSFGSSEKINFEGLQNSSAKLFPPYSLMMTSRATIGVLSINTTEACTNQGFITCLPNEQFPLFYLYYWLKTNTDYFIQLANGATFLEITKGKFKKIKILMPASPILQQYCRLQQPHFEAIKKLFRKLENLKTARNLLLSRLMSCKLTVDDLDICFPSSMQAEEAERPESGGPYHDLDHLAGGWSIEASEEFNRNTAMFEEIYDITV